MSYLVLARKYRPQTFAEIVGQEHVTRTLENAFARGRVHHAFLFCGARGVGKTTAARVLAKALCCEKGVGVACGECSACVTITDGTAVDYHEIDGASNNGVDDIRELRDGVRYQPAQLKRKIYVIDEVHMLSVAAFNALLKTLEEPPPHVTFIFATTEVHKIPVTILSRCQRYDFKLVPTPRLAAHLEAILGKENIAVEKGALSLLAREAGGSVRDSLSLTDQVIAYTGGETITEAKVAEVLGVADRGLLFDLARSVLAGDVRGALLGIEAASDRGVDLSHLARTFLSTLRDLAVVSEVKDTSGLVDASPDEVATLRTLTQGVHRVQLVALFERFARACEEMKESPAPRLNMEVALIDMAGSEPLVSVSELVERLDQMEKRARGGGGGGPGPGTRPTPRPAPPPARPVSSAPAAAPVPAPATISAPAPPPALDPVPAPVAVVAPVVVPVSVPVPGFAPAPAAPPPRRSAPDDPMAEWERLVSAMEITLAGVYAHARLLGWGESGLELAFPKGSLQAALGADADKLAKLKALVATQTGHAFDIKVKEIANLPPAAAPSASSANGTPAHMSSSVGDPPPAGASASVAELEDQRRRSERERREAEARQHPLTKAAIDTFVGATIKEIKVDG